MRPSHLHMLPASPSGPWRNLQESRTHCANNHETLVADEQGITHTKITRDSMDRPKFAKSTFSRKRAAPKPQHKPRDISAVRPWQPEPILEERARIAKVRRCATIYRTKAASQQVASAMDRIGANLKQVSTFERSDAKRARLLERVQERQLHGPATA